MIIDVAKLKDGVSQQYSEELDAKEIDVEYVDFHYTQKIKVEGTAEKILNTVTFQGSIQSSGEHICARCLKAVEEKIEDKLNLSYDVHGVEQINLLDDIRDTLLLSHAERFLCDEQCKGLCPHCGTNLNEKTCDCASKVRNNPFVTELKDFLKKKEK